MRRRAWVAFALGLVFTFLIAETTLRLVGSAHRLSVSSTGDKARFVIACLGNSHTAGTGAPPGFSYCDVLQREADRAQTQRPVKVVNLALPCLNSSQVLDRAQAAFGSLKPDLVLVMAGEPNTWNRVGLSRGSKQTAWENTLGFLDRWLYGSRVYRFLRILPRRFDEESIAGRSLMFPNLGLEDRARLATEWIGFLEDLSDSVLYSQNMALRNGPDQEALAAVSERAESSPLELATLWRARLLFFVGDGEGALRAYEQLLSSSRLYQFEVDRDLERSGKFITAELSPTALRLKKIAAGRRPSDYGLMNEYFQFAERESFFTGSWPTKGALATITPAMRPALLDRWASYVIGNLRVNLAIVKENLVLGRPAAALAVLERLARENPRALLHRQLSVQALVASDDEAISLRARRLLEATASLDPGANEGASSETNEELASWIERDLKKIVELSRSLGAEVVLQTYPPYRRRDNRRLADHVTEAVARKTGVPFFDTQRLLVEHFAGRSDRESYYSDLVGPNDHHLNAKGYEWVGRALWRFLSSERALVP